MNFNIKLKTKKILVFQKKKQIKRNTFRSKMFETRLKNVILNPLVYLFFKVLKTLQIMSLLIKFYFK